MSAVVLVVGEGLLADDVCRSLSAQCRVERQRDLKAGVRDGIDLAVVLHDGWNPAFYHEAAEILQRAKVPWLRGSVLFGEGIVGPLVRPGTPGCTQCADIRHFMAGPDREETWKLRQDLNERGGIPRDLWASRTGLLQMAHLIEGEVQNVLQDNQPLSDGQVFLFNLKTLTCSRHFILPDPLCSLCGQLPVDSAIAAKITLQPSPKVSADSYRCRPMGELKEGLLNDYLDYRTGLINGKMRDLISPFADMSVNLPLFIGDEGTAGRTLSYAESELTAILEALERYCGMAPRGKRTFIRDSYRNLAEQALDPVKVGLHSKEQYALPDFPFASYSPDSVMDWVWGYSLSQESPILVPELLAYYSVGCGRGFVYETSNGCALGGSLEEAIFYGILEVVERDAFLLPWYAKLPLPRLDLDSANDPELHLMIERVRAVAGYDLYLYNATLEHGIPSVWTIGKNRKKKGVNLICAAGAHPDPIRAVKGSIYEVASMLIGLNDKFEANRDTYRQMLDDPTLVKKMEDHSMLYSLPEAEERLHFLLGENRPLRTFDQEYKKKAWNPDLTDDLKGLLQAFRRLNLDVIVVDQTSPEILRNGLHCVKVLIPGMLPMTFGYHLTRLTGLERVLRVPAELGYAKQPLTPEQLNPHPHPFP
ncbi:TOMM precursor leader peptide-binding protein [Brevibacillus sp. B_LB10_24]|uniref:TOMM precursor leader peptide-binding protein n=1 Tax=Brevibacillus sp. B_LB10_24 TaxID=3380645 RepID=UPI0038B6EF03